MKKAAFAISNRMKVSNVINRTKNLAKVHDVRGPLAASLGIAEKSLPSIHFVEHHPSHLASAFFVSPFEDAAICAIDGFGDYVITSTAIGDRNTIELLSKVSFRIRSACCTPQSRSIWVFRTTATSSR